MSLPSKPNDLKMHMSSSIMQENAFEPSKSNNDHAAEPSELSVEKESVVMTSNKWTALFGEVAGAKHVRAETPCQDASFAGISPRPFLVACDGRGSAERSHFGSRRAIKAIQDQMTVSHVLWEKLLDEDHDGSSDFLEKVLADQFYRAAALVQKDLAEKEGGSPKDFEFTFIFIAFGKKNAFYIHVGDGSLIIERNGTLEMLSSADNGEFANITRFVQYGSDMKGMRYGMIPSAGIHGAAAFSDGTAEKMVELGTDTPHGAFSLFFQGMREQAFAEEQLKQFLQRPDWEPHVQDDRCLALLSSHNCESSAEADIQESFKEDEHPVKKSQLDESAEEALLKNQDSSEEESHEIHKADESASEKPSFQQNFAESSKNLPSGKSDQLARLQCLLILLVISLQVFMVTRQEKLGRLSETLESIGALNILMTNQLKEVAPETIPKSKSSQSIAKDGVHDALEGESVSSTTDVQAMFLRYRVSQKDLFPQQRVFQTMSFRHWLYQKNLFPQQRIFQTMSLTQWMPQKL